MNVKEITEGVYYAGVNDRVTALFEGLWPIPEGVSYNSYIVKGENATALIDTVPVSYTHLTLPTKARCFGSGWCAGE